MSSAKPVRASAGMSSLPVAPPRTAWMPGHAMTSPMRPIGAHGRQIAMSRVHTWAPIGLLGLVIAWPGIQAVRSGATGKALIPALGLTGFAELMWAIWLFAPLAR